VLVSSVAERLSNGDLLVPLVGVVAALLPIRLVVSFVARIRESM